MNRENLDKLATYLEGLPDDYAHFDMENYFEADDDGLAAVTNDTGPTECGTVACAVGHGPAAGVHFPSPEENEDLWRRASGRYTKNEWVSFDEEVFLPDWDKYCDALFTSDFMAWSWLFSNDWATCDNTPHGAAARIRYYLAEGRPPADWSVSGSAADFVPLYQEYLK